MTRTRLFLYLLILTLLPGSLSAEERFTSSQLRNAGVNAANLQPIVFSHDNRTLAAFDRADFEDKKRGVFYRLWLFQVNRDGSFGEAKKVELPLKTLEQGEFTPDDSKFVVLGNRGTTFYTIDLNDYSVSPLMEPEWGEAGFRADPPVLWTEGGKLFVSGRPYDKSRFVETRTVATLRPEAQDGEKFQRGPDISTLEKGLERLWFANYVSDRAAFFGQKYPQTTILSYWNGNRVAEFDRAWKYIGFWVNSGRLLFSTRRTDGGPCELALYDAASSSTKTIASSDKDYRYIFLSRNGETAITSQMDSEAERLIPFYARESENWELKPLITDRTGTTRTIPPGWMRLSSDGSMVCHVGANGLTLYKIGDL